MIGDTIARLLGIVGLKAKLTAISALDTGDFPLIGYPTNSPRFLAGEDMKFIKGGAANLGEQVWVVAISDGSQISKVGKQDPRESECKLFRIAFSGDSVVGHPSAILI